jgi:poly(hydroxyalkanoate) granule-associated protein
MSQTEEVLDRSKPLDRLLATGKSLFLAGVGAAAEVRESGIEMFDRLVERGKPLEARRKKVVGEVVERAARAVRGTGKLAQDTVEFESRGLLKRLNVMTSEDVKVLSSRISTLTKKVDEVVARRQASTASGTASEKTPETPIAAHGTSRTAGPRQRKATSER